MPWRQYLCVFGPEAETASGNANVGAEDPDGPAPTVASDLGLRPL
ncbi:protein of unassigned function [Methylobacterium oryzae CBMB20]|uniref:Protein of unassigned function n=1 Tax=Methylobacterium oryzae CBMB20 TaxID=693986 RepID=A0A089NXP0_9HYPH|nr:protein of unassigned function [Methylobacterium oryzae CBMB20]